MATDRFGIDVTFGTCTQLFESSSSSRCPGRWNNTYKSYNIHNEIDGDKDGMETCGDTAWNMFGQRCWVGTGSYRHWDCHDAVGHGTSNNNIVIAGGSYESIETVVTAGEGDNRGIFPQFDVVQDKRVALNDSWIAKAYTKNINTQEYWIRIQLPALVHLHEMYISDAVKPTASTTSVPINISFFENDAVEDTAITKMQLGGYKKLRYGDPTKTDTITAFGANNSAKITVDAPVKTILITFPRPSKFNTGFGIADIILVRIYNNYELNFNKGKNKFELFDYSGFIKNVEIGGKVNTLKYSSGYGLDFINTGHLKIENKILINPIKSILTLSANPTEIKPIVMISCWIKKPFIDTNRRHCLVSNEDGSFQPCVIEKNQNNLGAVINGEWYDSGIRIGELKNGWHYLMLFATNDAIHYFINGNKENPTGATNTNKYSGKTALPLPSTFNMDNIYIIGNSHTYGEPWGVISNLNLYSNWNKRYNDLQTVKIPVNHTSSDYLTKIETYAEKMWRKVSKSADSWDKHTCPDHSKVINKAVATAKANHAAASRQKLKRELVKMEKEIKMAVQDAENEAYEDILTFVSNSSNVIIWNNVNQKAKKIKLVSDNKSSSIGIKNIQVRAIGKDGVEKDWITNSDTVVELSSQPGGKEAVDLEYLKTYVSKKSGEKEDSFAEIKCPANEYMTSCKCWSPDNACEGSDVIQLQDASDGSLSNNLICRAHNKKFGSGVYAQAVCGKFTGLPKNKNIFRVAQPEAASGFSSDARDGASGEFVSGSLTNSKESTISCEDPTATDYATAQQYMLGCGCNSTNGGCDGTQIVMESNPTNNRKEAVCKAFAKPTGNVKAQAICMKIPGTKKMPNVAQKTIISKSKSGTEDNDPINITCPSDYKVVDGSCVACNDVIDGKCTGTNGSCDGSKININKNDVTAYNKEYGTGVHATANCMKFNIIDDNCIDGSLETECVTGVSEFPSITFTFGESIDIKKIVIYNRAELQKDNLPLNIHLVDDHDNIILTGVKGAKNRSYSEPMVIKNKPPSPPPGCKGFDALRITDKGRAINKNGKPEFRQWADIRGIGKNCDYCRIVGKDNSKMLSCALGNNSYNQYAYNTVAGADFGIDGTMYMYPESNDKKMDLCYLKETTPNKTSLECLTNTPNGFGDPFIPADQDSNYAKLDGNQILQLRKPFDTSKCTINSFENSYDTYKVDAGFYWPRLNRYFLFKNSILDSTNIVIFAELDAFDDVEQHGSPLIMNETNWAGVSYDEIDATLFVDMDPQAPGSYSVEFVYFFQNNEFIKYDLASNSVINNVGGDANLIKNEFEGLPFDSIDAACYFGDGNCIFFKNNQFVTYNMKAKIEGRKPCGSPSYISQASDFQQIPFTSRIDCAICFHDTPEKYMLFFKDDQVIEYNKKNNNVKCMTNSKLVAPADSIQSFFKTMNNHLWDLKIDITFREKRTLAGSNIEKKLSSDKESKKQSNQAFRRGCGDPPGQAKQADEKCDDNKDLISKLEREKRDLQNKLTNAKRQQTNQAPNVPQTQSSNPFNFFSGF